MADRPSAFGRGRGRGGPPGKQPSSIAAPRTVMAHSSEPATEQKLSEVRISEPQGPVAVGASTPGNGSVPSRGRGRGMSLGRGRGRQVQAQTFAAPELDLNTLAARYEEPTTSPASVVALDRKSPTAGVEDPDTCVTPPAVEAEESRVSPTATDAREEFVRDEGSPTRPESQEVDEVARGSTKDATPSGSKSKKGAEKEAPPVIRRGDQGIPVNLKTNYLRLRKKEECPGRVEYHVSFKSDDLPLDDTKLRRKLFNELTNEIWPVRSFDGMVLFLPYILENDVTVFETKHPGDPNAKVVITVTFVKVRAMDDCVIFYNILLKKVMRALQYVELRREYYCMDEIQKLSQHKLQIWHGQNITAENQEDGLMVCVDTCSRVLKDETVYDYYKPLRDTRDPQMREKLEAFVVGKIVLTSYNSRCYRVDHIEWNSNPNTTFQWKNNEISIKDYLMKQYKNNLFGAPVQVTDMGQPLLISKVKARRSAENQEDLFVALVPQLCHLTGLTECQKENFKIMTDLARSTRLTPAQRTKNLKDFIDKLLSNSEVHKILDEWGLYLERDVIEVVGRQMDGPELVFNERNVLKKAGPEFSKIAESAVFGPWHENLVNVQKYIIICSKKDEGLAKKFMDTYQEVCGPLGIAMPQSGEILFLRGLNPHNFSEALKEKCDPNLLQFVVVIMPTLRDDVYAAIKRHCVADKPIPSQCVLAKTLSNEKRLRSIVLKIALQINCKLGGSLWSLKMPIKGIMFVGIDAVHDPLKKTNSVICLIASLNNECTRYFSKAHESKVHEELSTNLRLMMKDALAQYRVEKGSTPNGVVVYRDGGSIGALSTIEEVEMKEIKEAVDEVCGTEVKFAFVAVTKRIPQRFILEQGEGNYVNPLPGTVVDHNVTRRHLYDFYIVSQQVREGTVNPTHYVVLNPQDDIRPDLIQRMTYATSFMYYNWPGTVRVPAMVQYAHKLAALLQRHVKRKPHGAITTTLYYL